jgi:hypothetical protein
MDAKQRKETSFPPPSLPPKVITTVHSRPSPARSEIAPATFFEANRHVPAPVTALWTPSWNPASFNLSHLVPSCTTACHIPEHLPNKTLTSHLSDKSDKSSAVVVSEETKEELWKLKKELKQLKRMSTMLSKTMREAETRLQSGQRNVWFAKPLVTSIKHRPRTEPWDIEKLYYVEGELEEMEYDREYTERDQFECTLKEEYIAVTHKNRYTHAPSRHDAAAAQIPYSLSDLSAFTS